MSNWQAFYLGVAATLLIVAVGMRRAADRERRRYRISVGKN